MTSKRKFLALDLSTQSLKAVVTDDNMKIVFEHSIVFDVDLPEFHTRDGVIRHSDGVTITSPTIMWVRALDLMLMQLSSSVHVSDIVVVSGTAQQHGSVYWKRAAEITLSHLNSNGNMADQLQECFVLQNSPVWMDASTSEQCKELEERVGGSDELVKITGSKAYERFTGNQIAKIYRKSRDAYVNCGHISLVSSFVASLFIGKYAPIDYSDGSGMNILNVNSKKWEDKLLDACGPNLAERLGDAVPSCTIIGNISPYLRSRYDFSPDCQVVAFTGDNPAALMGMRLGDGDIAMSLGTSDTLLFCSKEAKTNTNGHLFVNPINHEEYMAMLCFKNGSLPRQEVCDRVCHGSWDTFQDLLSTAPVGNDGNMAIFFSEMEILPLAQGIYRWNMNNEQVTSLEAHHEVRAIVEGQFLAKKLYAKKFGHKLGPSLKILATGGASNNKAILQVLSDVFNIPVYGMTTTTNAACLGCIYKCKQALLGGSKQNFFTAVENLPKHELLCQPKLGNSKIYVEMIERYEKLENSIVGNPK